MGEEKLGNKLAEMADEWTVIGHIEVDAGLVCLCDPIYIERAGAKINELMYSGAASQFDLYTTVGQAVVASTGYGDGSYLVEARLGRGQAWMGARRSSTGR